MEDFEREIQITATKIRWARINKGVEDIAHMRDVDDINEEEEAEKEVFMNKRVFKDETKQVDLGFRRSTDMKTSRRVIFPPGRSGKEEAKIETRIAIWKEVIQRYMRDNCSEEGRQEVNLSKSQSIGRMKINKRVRKREIHVSPSDKGKGMVVMSLEMYSKLVEVHTSKDREVSWSQIEEASPI